MPQALSGWSVAKILPRTRKSGWFMWALSDASGIFKAIRRKSWAVIQILFLVQPRKDVLRNAFTFYFFHDSRLRAGRARPLQNHDPAPDAARAGYLVIARTDACARENCTRAASSRRRKGPFNGYDYPYYSIRCVCYGMSGDCLARELLYRPDRRIIMTRFWNTALLGAALMAPIAMTPTTLRAQDHKARTYHDKQHNDDHEWNSHEDQAYGMWAKQNHRKHSDFSRLKD